MSKFRDTINREMDGIQLSDDIKMSVLDSKYAQKKKRFNVQPLVVAVASICTASVLTIGVGAVACGGVSEFINGVNIMFEPINETCTSNGIKVTVLSAGIDSTENKTMSAYVTLEDTTDQDRITRDSVFQCSVRLDGKDNDYEHAYMNSTMVSFDEATHVATYKIVATMDWWSKFTNKNTIQSLDIYNGVTTDNNVAKDIDLYTLAKDNLDSSYDTNWDSVYSVDTSGSYGCYKGSTTPDVEYTSIMDNAEPIQIDDDTQLMAIGFVDGHLHVKLKLTNYYESAYSPEGLDVSQYVSLGKVRLVDGDGKDTLNTDEYYSSISTTYSDTHTQVTEVCFNRVHDVSTLEGLKLSYEVTTTTTIDGEWSITFKVDPTTQG